MAKGGFTMSSARAQKIPLRIALLGAESTGKSTLAQILLEHFESNNIAAVLVPEMLREFCTKNLRVPLANEQNDILQSQIKAEQDAESGCSSVPPRIVISDCAPITIAIYSSLYFGDSSLFGQALEQHKRYAMSFVMATDIGWHADPLPFMRDGVKIQTQFHERLLAWLKTHSIDYQLIEGKGPMRSENALSAIIKLIR